MTNDITSARTCRPHNGLFGGGHLKRKKSSSRSYYVASYNDHLLSDLP